MSAVSSSGRSAVFFLSILEGLGRTVMDLGFGAFLERFEEHFGKGWAKFMLVLIGLAIVSVCASVVWTTLVWPIAEMVAEIWPEPGTARAWVLAKFIVFTAFFLMAVNWSLDMANNYLKVRLNRKLAGKLKTANEVLERSEESLAKARVQLDNAHNVIAAAELAMDRIFAYALENEMLTAEEVAELRGQLDKEETGPEERE